MINRKEKLEESKRKLFYLYNNYPEFREQEKLSNDLSNNFTNFTRQLLNDKNLDKEESITILTTSLCTSISTILKIYPKEIKKTILTILDKNMDEIVITEEEMKDIKEFIKIMIKKEDEF